MNSRVLWAVVFLLVPPAWSHAHGLGVEAKLKGSTVRVEVYFDDDTPTSGATVTVTNEAGHAVAEGKTDAAGVWSFATPAGGKYRVVANAGDGHLAKTTITIPQQLGSETAPASSEQIVSAGPTRAETTGPKRWLMAVVGIVAIALLTLLLQWVTARRKTTNSTSQE